MPFCAGGDQLLDRSDFAVVVAVEFAGIGLRREAEFLGLGLEAFLHFDEEGIGVGLGDQADDIAGVAGGAGPDKRESDGGARQKCESSRHEFLPNTETAAVSALVVTGDEAPSAARVATVLAPSSPLGQMPK